MAVGRKPRPTALKVIEGNPGKHKLPKNEPKPRPVRPEMPAYLDTEGRKRWEELVSDLESIGVLTVVDREVLGGYCAAFASFVSATRILEEKGWVTTAQSGYEMPSPWVAIRNRAMDDLRRFGAELGIGAASRSRIEVKKPDADEDIFAELKAASEADAAHRRRTG